MGGMTFRRMYGKQTIMKTPDMSRVKWSKAQKEHRQRFRKAVIYARMAMANPKVRAHYEKAAAKKGKRPFHLAVSDFFQGKNLLEGQTAPA
jgi:predicted double-glycine peptidase